MRSTSRRKKLDAAPSGGHDLAVEKHDLAVEKHELELLAEFVRHDSVASLAGAIAYRLGGDASEKDLIASADLGASRRKD